MSSARREPRLSHAPGRFRLRALPAADVWHAQGTLTLHAVGPRSTVSVAVDTSGLLPGDMAGLALFNRPYAWLGVERGPRGASLAQFDERTGRVTRVPLRTPFVFLRAECDMAGNLAAFQFSADGRHYTAVGLPYLPASGEDSTRSIRCSVFCVAAPSRPLGGHADFAGFNLVTDPALGEAACAGRGTSSFPVHALSLQQTGDRYAGSRE